MSGSDSVVEMVSIGGNAVISGKSSSKQSAIARSQSDSLALKSHQSNSTIQQALQEKSYLRYSFTNEKPPYTYINLIKMAILDSPSKLLTLSEICQFIMNKFPFYRQNQKSWQIGICKSLSNIDCFVKLPRTPYQPSKEESFWTVHPDVVDESKNKCSTAVRPYSEMQGALQVRSYLQYNDTNGKPPYLEVNTNLIKLAILSHHWYFEYNSLAEITFAIVDFFPFYRQNQQQAWQDSVYHMLSTNECFVSKPNFSPKSKEESLWKVDLKNENTFEKDCPDSLNSAMQRVFHERFEKRRKRTDFEKPSYSYSNLIKMAIVNAPSQMLTTANICKVIEVLFPFYLEKEDENLRDRICHTLSVNDCFVKVPCTPYNPNKVSIWTIHQESNDRFENECFQDEKLTLPCIKF